METVQNTESTQFFNIASHLRRSAETFPYKRAVVCPCGRDCNGRPRYVHLTFNQLDRQSDALAWGLEQTGITRGMRTVLMVKPGIEFFTLTFALFKIGAVPVVVDPGMGYTQMLHCLHQSRPEAFVGIPAAHAFRKLFPKYFATVKICITLGRRWFWGGYVLNQIARPANDPYPLTKTTRDETAAILFTTGSTGPAKGAVYTHGIFDAQIRHIRSHFGIASDEIDLPTFPLFALFDPALGMTAVIPDMDPTKPALADPKKIIETIFDQGVTNMFASPALLNRIGGYAAAKNIQLPSLKRVVSAGAPVSPSIIERFVRLLPEDVEVHTPYGATEAVPIISIASKEILSETKLLSEQGFGTCVGRPLEGIDVRIIKIMDSPITEWSEQLIVPDGDIGEISVKGDLVTRHYFERPRADALMKIKEGKDVWHRMGDLGWKDKKGRIWFCGRKSHRVVTEHGTLFTIPCEAVFNSHPRVFRSALVGIGAPPKQRPVICIELEPGDPGKNKKKLRMELLEAAKRHEHTKQIDTLFFHRAFPVDIRHNSKIFREKLADWAERKLR